MSIPLFIYRENFFPNPDLTKIFDIPTYESFHKMQLELKTNAISIHSNLGGAAHGNLVLLITDARYSLISNATYEQHLHIPNNATPITADVLKRSFDENLHVFHEVWG